MMDRSQTLVLVAFFCLPWAVAGRAQALSTYEVYSSRAAFEARLNHNVTEVHFDDINTATADPVSFLSDRYKADKGMLIEGDGGQYVSRNFGLPSDFPGAPSSPNYYAPGPVAPLHATGGRGGFNTSVTFFDGHGDQRRVAGFGLDFIDADFPGLALSGLEVFQNVQVPGSTAQAPSGGDGFQSITTGDGQTGFLGIVAIDLDTNLPVNLIELAHIVNGDEWPGVDVSEDVALDNFVYGLAAGDDLDGKPIPEPLTTMLSAMSLGALAWVTRRRR